MLEKFANIFRIPDLRKRVLFTLGLLAVYRLGAFIPTPGINADALMQYFNANSGSALGLADLFYRRKPAQVHHLRARHHALHHRVDHLPAAHRHL
jgi:hypothetical protein